MKAEASRSSLGLSLLPAGRGLAIYDVSSDPGQHSTEGTADPHGGCLALLAGRRGCVAVKGSVL